MDVRLLIWTANEDAAENDEMRAEGAERDCRNNNNNKITKLPLFHRVKIL